MSRISSYFSITTKLAGAIFNGKTVVFVHESDSYLARPEVGFGIVPGVEVHRHDTSTEQAGEHLVAEQGGPEGFWLGLQADHDLLQRRREIDADLARIAPYRRAA